MMTKSEMKKVGNPYKNDSFGREAYYTNISFKLDNIRINAIVKVDTGAAYTVLGLKYKKIERFANTILKSNMHGVAYDASGTELKLYGYVVENFRLTCDITLDKIKLFFSEDIGDKALLGMDILSIFDFQYLKERRQNWGTFWINNYEDALRELSDRRLNKNIDYIDPVLIANVENIKEIQRQ